MPQNDNRVYVVVDLETTGGRTSANKITEIGMVKFDGDKIIDRFEALVNPQRPIPPFIQRLTSITDEMVEGEPVFGEFAERVLEFLKDSVFVAHNVGFDYNVLKKEFKELDIPFNMPRVCTVRLGRHILPGLPSYSLGKFCKSMGITISGRHRAMGDALATTELLKILIENDKEDFITDSLKRSSKEAVLPPHLQKQVYEDLPLTPGIYYFLDKKDKPIYIGKAKNIQKRVLSHFRSDSEKELRIRASIANVEFEETGSELLALIRECEEIKATWPKFNNAYKRYGSYWGLFSYEDQTGYRRLAIDKVRKGTNPVKIFGGMWSGRDHLWSVVKEYELCARLCGLTENCEMALGVMGKSMDDDCNCMEEVPEYNQKVEDYLEIQHSNAEKYIIIEKGRSEGELALIMIEDFEYRGSAFIDKNAIDSEDFDTLSSFISPSRNYPEMRAIIESYIAKSKRQKIVRPEAQVDAE